MTASTSSEDTTPAGAILALRGAVRFGGASAPVRAKAALDDFRGLGIAASLSEFQRDATLRSYSRVGGARAELQIKRALRCILGSTQTEFL